MNNENITGYINSIQTLGTVDGPGVRFVAFMQGCNLRCGCCHNPETHSLSGGTEYTASELFKKACRYKAYFGKDGGVTLSGGEPLLQPEFAKEFFSLCHENNINTCLDTSGSVLNDTIKQLLSHTDRVLLDIKYTDNEMYKKYAGCEISTPLRFLEYLNESQIPVTLRQVIIKSLNDNETNIKALAEIINKHSCIDKVELLPFKKICETKYKEMKIPFPFAHIPATPPHVTEDLLSLLNTYTNIK